MSAYQVSQAHLATLATYGSASGRFGGIVAVANKLAEENAKSVNYRYASSEPCGAFVFDSESEVFKHYRSELHRQAVVILKAVKCLEYQSCEHPGWQESEARQILKWITSDAIRALPGYSEAEGWSIDAAPKAKAYMLVRK